MKLFLFLTGTFLLLLPTYGQGGGTRPTIGIEWGPSLLTRQDLIFSPFKHTGFSMMHGGIRYTRTNRVYQHVSVQYAGYSSMLVEPYAYTEHGEPQTAGKHLFTYLNLDYTWAKPIDSGRSNTFWVGGAFDADLHILNYVYGRFGGFGYYANFGLNAFGRYTFDIGQRQHGAVTVEVPLASWLARSPYAVNDDEFIENTASHNGLKTFFAFLADGQLASWGKQQSLQLSLSYSNDIGSRWTIGADYAFEFIHSVTPRPLYAYQNNFSITGSYKLK